jgi:hypothetical protein
MKATDIILVDYLHNDSQHESFNLSVIRALESFVSISTSFFVPGSTSGSYLGSFRELPDTRSWRLRQLSTLPLLFSILLFARSKPNHSLVFLQVLPLHYLCLVVASLFVLRGNPIFVCMHGELAALSTKRLFAPYRWLVILSWIASSCFKVRLRFLCIDRRVFDNITNDFGAFESVSWIQHFVVREYAPGSHIANTELGTQRAYGAFRLGSIGVHSLSKNSAAIFKAADEIDSKDIKFFTCGLSDGSFEYKESLNVTHLFKGLIGDTYIDSEVYFDAIRSNIDIVLLFHGPESGYRYVVSGIVYDLIWLAIPAICSEGSPLLEYTRYYDFPFVSCDFTRASIYRRLTYLERSFFANANDRQLTTNQNLREISIARWRCLLEQ